MTTIAPGKYHCVGWKRAIPFHSDHFDFPCCCGVWNWTWHCTLPCSVGTFDMGVSAWPALWCPLHVTCFRRETVIGNISWPWISCSSPLVCFEFFIFFFLFSVFSLRSCGQREGVYENPLQWMFVYRLRVVSNVKTLPRFPHGLLVPCKTPT